ncbi:MAG: 4Fe-4S ferredoxin [Bacteroidetes bacterium GWF2_38_335]|nr:MAG: 4Fe-4S ferredoxin [Bacteroidetes bacterium GWF2_38_335]OFY76973.1 MAG: 4Fe-4S ferredoxin [Bacteroidetes bacterium RIFOXYA12_FULL_38_20]HBS86828.1 4Fe-4S ferredoxin [Bacteroidales bacterium]
MEREIVKINDELCDGCGKCVPNCHEGALQIIDGKAVLISDLMCDGLGACIGHCPQGAITIEKREAEAYNEVKVMAEMVLKGKNTVIAHLKHLRDHNEHGFMKEGMGYLQANKEKLGFDVNEVVAEMHKKEEGGGCHSGGCPGSKPMSFEHKHEHAGHHHEVGSQLTHWPVQLHLINPAANFFQNKDVVIAADCTAFAYGDFHNRFMKGKSLVIACPKLDQGQDIYVEKIRKMVDEAKVNTITVVIMEVPCCGGLLQIVRSALSQCTRKVPVKGIVIGIQGEILEEDWM